MPKEHGFEGPEQLRLLREPLLSDDARHRAIDLVSDADSETKSRWREEAERLVSSLTPEVLRKSTEPSLQGTFLEALFVRLLGYSSALSGRRPFTLSEHVTTEIDATEADGTLGWFSTPGAGETRAVIELKDARTNLDKRQLARRDRLTPIDQAFLYSTKFQGCDWIIVSNFLEVRLYSSVHGQRAYDSFDLRSLSSKEFLDEFVALFRPEALIGEPGRIGYLRDYLDERPAVRERDITGRFYEHYANERNRLLQHFMDQGSDANNSDLILATQTLLDRILFICFAEDTGTLLPTGILRRTAEVASQSRSRSPARIWDELRELFRDIDEGRKDVQPPIPGYNGGLFARSELLDERLTVSDSLAWELVEFSKYDYRHSINVEVLGHIFEQSISDLESLHRLHSIDPDAAETDPDAIADTRRSRGIYYTPRWVTEYIADVAVGQLAQETGFDQERLAKLTIIDPACGSGAFLAQAFRYLLEVAAASVPEALTGEQPSLESAIRPSLFLRSLFGIDIMPEAVDIARLSLWLASATPNEQLQSIDGIREGNTLSPPNGDAGPGSREFDVCIGNPPWGAEIDYTLDPSLQLAHGQYDSYELFVERALGTLVREGGVFGFIVPDRLLRPEGERLRRWLFDNFQVQEMLKLGEGVFPGVFRASVILIVKKAAPSLSDQIRTLIVFKADRELLETAGATQLRGLVADRGGPISRARIVADASYDVPLGATDEDLEIMETMRRRAIDWTTTFSPYGRGVELGTDGFVIRCNACFEWQVGPRRIAQSRGGGYNPKTCNGCGATLTEADWQQQANIIVDDRPDDGSLLDRTLPGSGWKPLYPGPDVSRYQLGKPKWIRLGVPNIEYKDDALYAAPKLLIRQTGVAINAAVDESEALCLESVYVYRVGSDIDLDAYYFLGCLASRAMLFYFHRMTNQLEWQSFPRLVHQTLRQLPLPDIRQPGSGGRQLHDEIARKARERMGMPLANSYELDLALENLVMDAFELAPPQRQRIMRSLQSVQRLRVIREMFPDTEAESLI